MARRLRSGSIDRIEGAEVLASRSEVRRGEWDHFQDGPIEVRPMGSVAYKMALVAAGLADATWTLTPKNEWDVAAGTALVDAGRRHRYVPRRLHPHLQQPRPIDPRPGGGSLRNRHGGQGPDQLERSTVNGLSSQGRIVAGDRCPVSSPGGGGCPEGRRGRPLEANTWSYGRNSQSCRAPQECEAFPVSPARHQRVPRSWWDQWRPIPTSLRSATLP